MQATKRKPPGAPLKPAIGLSGRARLQFPFARPSICRARFGRLLAALAAPLAGPADQNVVGYRIP